MEQKRSPLLTTIIVLISVAAGVVFDQYTKWLAVRHLKDQKPFIIIEGVFSLQYLENRGAAFGLMQNQRALFLIGAAIITLLILYCFIKMPHSKRFMPLSIIGICVLIGAFGNLIDRVRLGYVVDFFYFELIDFPIFNVADIFLTVSVSILILLILFYYKEEDLSWLSFKGKSEQHQKE